MLSKEQETIVSHFKKAVREKSVCHSYIITGPEGVGKKTLADALSLVFSCEKNEGCGKCARCLSSLKGANPDILRIRPEEKKDYSVDKIREIIKKVYEKSSSLYKLIIFEDAHRLTKACQNALLKIVEEPPSYAVFVFLTPSEASLLSTMRSRSFVINMHPWKREELMEKFPLPDEKSFYYELSDSNPGKLKSLLEDKDFYETREETIKSFVAFVSDKDYSVFDIVKTFEKDTERLRERIETLSLIMRDTMLFKKGAKELIISKDKLKEIEILSNALSLRACAGAEKIILDYFKRCSHRENPTMTIQSLFMRLEEEINDRSGRNKV